MCVWFFDKHVAVDGGGGGGGGVQYNIIPHPCALTYYFRYEKGDGKIGKLQNWIDLYGRIMKIGYFAEWEDGKNYKYREKMEESKYFLVVR